MDFTVDVDLPTIEIPCPKLPEVDGLPTIPLLGGAELKAFLDFASGPSTDCKLSFNLLIQLGPVLASMACLMKILGVFKVLMDFISAVPDPFKLAKVVPDTISAITDLLKCFPPFAIINIIMMIIAIIKLIIKFLMCLIDMIMSIINILDNIHLDIAFGNKPLIDAFTCQQESANNSFANLMTSLESLAPIITIIQLLIGLAGGGISIGPMPDINAIRQIKDPKEALAAVQGAVATFEAINASLDKQLVDAQAAAAAAAAAGSGTSTSTPDYTENV